MIAAGVVLMLMQTVGVQVLAVPVPMETVRERLEMRNPPVGLWNIYATGIPGETISGETIVMSIVSWCRANKAPIPLFLTKEQAWPIITTKSGGKWKFLRRMVGYAGVGLALSGFPAAATAGPVLDLMNSNAQNRIPDVNTVLVELPERVIVPASGGLRFSVWSAKMKQSPVVIGPVDTGPARSSTLDSGWFEHGLWRQAR